MAESGQFRGYASTTGIALIVSRTGISSVLGSVLLIKCTNGKNNNHHEIINMQQEKNVNTAAYVLNKKLRWGLRNA